MSTGANLRRARLSAGMTQGQLAQAIGHSSAHIGLLESGDRRFNEEMLERVSRVLGLRPSSLLDNEAHDEWQEGFAAGVAAARRALMALEGGTK